ncbi:MAG: hypothetical protein AAFR67_04900 [Chloroflexota bacterium]
MSSMALVRWIPNMPIAVFPTELDMLVNFSIEPIFSVPNEGHYSYVHRLDNLELQLSFHDQERWIKTMITHNDSVISDVTHEGAKTLNIRKHNTIPYLYGICQTKQTETKLTIHLVDKISVEWGILVIHD